MHYFEEGDLSDLVREREVSTSAQVALAYDRGQRLFRRLILDNEDFTGIKLRGASFYGSSLRSAQLSGLDLSRVQFKAADLSGACLDRSSLGTTDLIAANFTGASLQKVDFTGAALNRTNFTSADLRRAYFNNVILEKTVFSDARLDFAVLSTASLVDTNLSQLCNCRTIRHESPSGVDSRSVLRSYQNGNLRDFMTQCGVPLLFAEYMIECARAIGEPNIWSAMQSTFISYGGPDEKFARRLYDGLRSQGVVAFLFPEDAVAGERINNEVYRNLQAYDRIILVCSRNSLNRAGVLNEIQETLDREARDGGVSYLIPIIIDDYLQTDWKEAQPVLAERVGARVVADFRRTKTQPAFMKALNRLLLALRR